MPIEIKHSVQITHAILPGALLPFSLIGKDDLYRVCERCIDRQAWPGALRLAKS